VEGKYTVKKIVFIKLSAQHIPYYAYMIVAGPKGGIYVVDEFNTEVILKRIMPNTGERTSIIMHELARRYNKLEYRSDINNVDAFIKGIKKCNRLYRRQGIELAIKMSKSLTM